MITTQFNLNVGVVPGYFHDNNHQEKDQLTKVAQLFQEEAEKVYQEISVYVSAIVTATKTTYRPEWGCPKGGEITITISGLRNPEFQKDDQLWRTAVTKVANRVAKALYQTTAYLFFGEIDFVYLIC